MEAIERATLKALPPLTHEDDDGWLLAANGGVIGRANSVVPLEAGRDALVDKVERALGFYARRDLRPAFRISTFAAPEGLAPMLATRGFAPEEATVVMVADIGEVSLAAPDVQVQMTARASDAWIALFAGPAGKPEQARLRAETLTRGQGTQFAEVFMDDAVVAIGAVSIDGPWAGVHGMRTAPSHRGRGLARALIARNLSEAQARGAERFYLQVEEANEAARRLYANAGFTDAYRYDYWRLPKAT